MMVDSVVVHCSMMMHAMVAGYHFAMMNRLFDTLATEHAASQMNQSLNCSPHHIGNFLS